MMRLSCSCCTDSGLVHFSEFVVSFALLSVPSSPISGVFTVNPPILFPSRMSRTSVASTESGPARALNALAVESLLLLSALP